MSEEPRPMGRPPADIKLLGPKIIDALRVGNTIGGAIAGLIHRNTYLLWLEKGENDLKENIKSDFSEFFNNVNQAKRDYVNNLRRLVENAGEKDWKAASWLLERKDPENYHLKQKIETTQTIEVTQKAILEIPNNERRNLDDSESI